VASSVDICNRALQKLGAERITSLLQDSEDARACNLCFEHLRDAELRSHPWNFAITRAQLAADATAPAFGFATSYTLPADFIRLLPPDPWANYNTLDWQIEGKKILTNDTGVLEIRYIYRVEDTNQFDSLFNEVLANRIAVELCEQLTQSNAKGQQVRADYLSAVREARRLNAFENVPAEQQTDKWITARL
jgi:hypothetical protein